MKNRFKLQGVVTGYETRSPRPVPPHLIQQAIELGVMKRVFRVSNLVVANGLAAMSAMQAGGQGNPTVGGIVITPSNFQNLYVDSMKLTDFAAATVPTEADVALQGTPVWVGSKDGPPSADALMLVTYPPYPSQSLVNYSVVIPPLSLVGVKLYEEALFAKNGVMIARVTYYYEKQNQGLQLDHTIQFMR
jgi:hypothetical protein